MPILTYKCNFCHTCGTKKTIMDHEKACVFNPKLRTCTSCGNYLSEDVSGAYSPECKIKVKDFMDIWDENKACLLWIPKKMTSDS